MARRRSDPAVVRPSCPEHPGSRVRLDGFEPCRWSDAHRRPRFRCVTVPGTRGHSFSVPVAVRQPTERHPDSGVACPTCEHVYGRHEGVRTGRDFVFGHAEIARLFLRIGEGMSLRAASRELRESVFRACQRHRLKPGFKSIRPGGTSRQANLAVNYLDAFAPSVIAALHPTEWPRAVVLDTTTLFTRGYRPTRGQQSDEERTEARVGNLKAGTILVALDGTVRGARPCLMRVAGGKDADSWTAFFALLAGAPGVVVADLDAAIGRAVRETWPEAILLPSRHHLAAQMRERALADGVPERIRADEPIPLDRPLPWTGERTKRWTSHPLHDALLTALRGPAEWAALLELVERHVPPDRLALRSWIATNEPLIRRGWLITERHPELPRSTGALEGAIGEWLAPIRRRAGRWQNARRLDLALGLMTLRARGEAREVRYAKLIRAAFAARGNRSHLPAENELPTETYRGEERQMSWWRTWHDRTEASLPRLVREAGRRWRRRATSDHTAAVKERLAERYTAEVDLRTRLGLPAPPSGRPKRPTGRETASVRGRRLTDYPDLLAEWAWEINADLDPARLAAGSHERVAWRCLLDPAHVWETKVADRTHRASACPYHMGVRVHPAESLAAYYPWLALEWHPTRNTLRPDQVTRASAREVVWRCEQGHEWSTPIYQRTLSGTGCPDCYRLTAAARSDAGRQRARRARDDRALAEVVALHPSAASSEAV
ncbi:MAG: zinc-ribbon domain-containing protein [Chloroflexota bacterium]